MSEPIKLTKNGENQITYAPSVAQALLQSGWVIDDGSAPVATPTPAIETPLKEAPKAKTAPRRRRKTASK